MRYGKDWNKWRVTHGLSKSRAMVCWAAMLQRCLNPKNPNYKNYGARGIKVCDRWLKFQNFYDDMGAPPDGLSLDRIDNEGNYELSNCRWATPQQQLLNTRRTRMVEINGQTKSLSQWADELGINRSTLYKRINRSGWTPERAILTEVGKYESVN